MKTFMKSIVALVCMFFFLNLAYCQITPDSTLIRIETKDGNEYIGWVIHEDAAHVIFRTNELGEIDIPVGFIKSRTIINPDRIIEGSLWFDNPQSSRYFWSPNGYGLKKGEGYYQNIWVLYNQVSIGVTDNFSIGAGMVPLFLFSTGVTPIWVIPKFSFPIVQDKFNLGVGVIAGVIAGEGNSAFGILYGVATIGNRDKNLNFGFGWGYAGDNWAEKPILSISGMTRLNTRSYLLTENYYINLGDQTFVLLSAGGRSFIKKVGLDYMLVMPIGDNIDKIFAIPVLGITLPFGNVRASK